MKHIDTTWLAAAALAALAAACVTPGGAENTYTSQGSGSALDPIEGNPQLADQLRIVNPRSKTLDGRLVVEFDLHNQRPSALMVEYTVEWFDAQGFQVRMPANWVPLQIGGGGVRSLQITGPTTSASQWRLHLRPRNEVK